MLLVTSEMIKNVIEKAKLEAKWYIRVLLQCWLLGHSQVRVFKNSPLRG